MLPGYIHIIYTVNIHYVELVVEDRVGGASSLCGRVCW